MDELDELDIDLQDSDDIGSRLVLLSALTIWPDLTESDEQGHWWEWLDREGVLDVATHGEITVLSSPSADAADELSARSVEAMLPLAWSVGLLPELLLRSGAQPAESLLEGLPVPSERIEPFLNGLILLDEDAIAVERERAEIWNWRLGAEARRRQSPPAEFGEIEEAIREVVLEAASALVISENDGSDFLIEGAPVREVETALVDWLLIVTEERLRALNWICGLTEWDQIDIED